MRVRDGSEQISRGGRLALLTVALLALGALPGAASSPALIVRVNGHRLSYQPVHKRLLANKGHASPMAGKQMTYHGGPVMTSNTNYTIYWDPAGAPAYPAGYQTGINRYFEDVAHDSGSLQTIDSVLAQYTNGTGEAAAYESHFGGALADTDPYPANGCTAAPICLTQAQIQAEVVSYVEAHKLPTDLQHEYFVLTPQGVESCFEASGLQCSSGTKHAAFCAFHSSVSAPRGTIVYANDPYVNGLNCDFEEEHPNNNPSDAEIGGGLAHEHAESVTDPLITAWYDTKGEEVADKCRTFKASTEYGTPLGQAPDGANYNQVIDGDLYYYQQVWSNEAAACQQRAAALPVVTKIAPKAGSKNGGTSVTITGSGFVGTVTVEFGSTPASGVTVNSSTSITAVSPAGSPGVVDVTVTTSAGTSAIVKKDHFKYKPK
jgi:IPT/TIG domain